MWVEALRKNVDQSGMRIRDVLAIDLPLNKSNLESAFNIPRDSAKAFAFVLDTQGKVIARVMGEPNDAKLSEVEKAVRSTN